MIGIQNESSFGVVVLVLCLLFILIGLIWLELVEKPNKRKEMESQLNQLKQIPDLLFSGKKLLSKLDLIGTLIQPCKKCGDKFFTIWDIEPFDITIRCNDCKKKYNYKDEDLEKGIVQDLILYHNNYYDLWSIKNPLLQEFKLEKFDFSRLRKN